MKFDAHCPECSKSTTWTLVVSKEMQERQQIEKATPVAGTSSRMRSQPVG